jgi:hypothetical protein
MAFKIESVVLAYVCVAPFTNVLHGVKFVNEVAVVFDNHTFNVFGAATVTAVDPRNQATLTIFAPEGMLAKSPPTPPV